MVFYLQYAHISQRAYEMFLCQDTCSPAFVSQTNKVYTKCSQALAAVVKAVPSMHVSRLRITIQTKHIVILCTKERRSGWQKEAIMRKQWCVKELLKDCRIGSRLLRLRFPRCLQDCEISEVDLQENRIKKEMLDTCWILMVAGATTEMLDGREERVRCVFVALLLQWP